MKRPLLFVGLLGVALIAQILSQYRLFSLFQAITSIPLMIMLITPLPAALALTAFIFLELFSSLPHGSMAIMFIIPYIVLFFWKGLKVDFSWKFFLGVMSIIILQNAALIGILAVVDFPSLSQIPWYILAIQIPSTSAGTFALSFIYHEYF
ncbi:MAG TPA: hypothetical protein VJI96_03310 [Candidatus Andersenbacteria bacterium]|nr:hypothetical protein [Candidatus Andersenbacteria bacterium]